MASTVSPETGLPALWEVRHSQSKNLPYYFNTSTKESRWEPPSGTDASLIKNYMASHHSSSLSIPPPKSVEGQRSADSKIRAAHLLVKHEGSRRPSSWKEEKITRSKKDAVEVLRRYEGRIKGGEIGLGDLAASESDCSSARKKGDLIGKDKRMVKEMEPLMGALVHRGFFGRGDMQKEFEEAAFTLQPGEVSGIVETASGVHLIERLVSQTLYTGSWCLSDRA
ncbi:uncharacterized protein KY384_003160 [Bacidia gigantensis]|uniref:uncharacterized protein n=1 Tax=Bacidia gigantensis TaxID=2732470 RepID=UPI001D04AD03|nr:uncharacterized protein KY384_003160 [Bacidia gigantensis]KAG8531531.1 hypothetical protein KY384_003160 [Bacidia gigantensis]